MFRYTSVLSLVAFALLAAPSAVAQEAEELTEAQQIYASLEFSAGPGTFDVTSRAEIDLPEGFDRLNAEDTAKLMALYENPTSTKEFYVAPTDERWFSVFSYDDTGHIKDDEEIDAGDLLKSIREGTEYSNRERRERGWPEMTIVGWQSQPSYSDATNRLSWAIIGESAGQQIVNYNTRLLGRTGVMSATLVAAPEDLETAIAEFETMLEGFRYKPGNLYAEYQEGDKLATYGLAALVTGGAAAAVAKGAGKGLFKAIGLGILAFFAFFGRIFKKLFSRNTESA